MPCCDPPSPGVDPNRVIYTDASLRRQKPLGCGVFDAPNDCKYSYRSDGPILFGELLAILIALSLRPPDEPLHILTDSLVGLLLINRAVFFADSVRTHVHARLLHAIASRVRSRTAPTTLGKVRGHAGVAGNVQADACARAGADPAAPPVPADLLPPAGSGEDGRPCLHIPAGALDHPLAADEDPAEVASEGSVADDAMSTDAPDTDPPVAQDAPLPPATASDLSDNVFSLLSKLLVRRRAQQPAATRTAQRLQHLFGPTLTRVALKPSMYFSTPAARVTEYARCLCLKLRYNAVYCGWKQNKSKRVASPNCALCHRFDHDTHPVGDCAHPQIARMNIQTHNAGGQLVLAAFRKISNCAVLANLGDGEAAPHDRTLPSWLGLPSRLAPDILIIQGWTQQKLDAGEFPTSESDKQKVTLLFIEYKTCSDFALDHTAERIWRKYTPHAGCPRPHRCHLFWALRRLGWTVQGLDANGALGVTPSHDRMLHILVGHAGFILQSTLRVAFQTALGLSRPSAHKLACSLNAHQVACAARVFGTWHSLKRLQGNPASHHATDLASASRTLATRRKPATATGVG
jgi:RNase H